MGVSVGGLSVQDIQPEWRRLLTPLFLAEDQDPHWSSTRHHQVIDYEFRNLVSPGNPWDILIITCPPRHGKQLANDTPVWTPRGFIPHGELCPGDELYAPDGSITRVVAVSRENSQTDHKVAFSDGAEIVAHARHEWVVYDRALRRERQMETQELLAAGLHAGFSRNGSSRNRFMIGWPESIDEEWSNLPIHPYFLGVWLGDGRSKSADICGAPTDMAFILGRLDGLGYKVSSVWYHKITGVMHASYTDGMRKKLRALGVLTEQHERGSRKHIPLRYFLASIEQRRELLAGLVDTDGSVDKSGRAHYATGSQRLAEDVATLVRTLGYRAGISITKPSLSTSGIQGKLDVYYVSWSAHDGLPQGRLPRKAGRPNCIRRMRSIDSIEIVPGVPGKCIEVEHPSGMYLAGRTLIPTHNSTYLSHWAPAHYLLRNPSNRVMLCSYGMRLAKFLSRRVRDRVHRCAPAFGLKGVNPMVSAADDWELEGQGGGMMASGVEGSIIGRGANLILIDDYIRKGKDAASPTVRENQWEWFQSTVSTRREPGGKICILATPWVEDDLIGRIMSKRDELGLNVRRVAFQAIRVNDGTPDPLGRAEGESLWPERWPVEVLDKQRRLMGPYWWQAQYQGVPGQYGRNEWPASYFANIWAQEDEWPEAPLFSAVALDPSKGAHEDSGDYQAMCYAAFHAGKLWLDFDVDRRPVPQMMRDFARFCYDRRPGIVGIEANAFQDLLAPDYIKACQDIGYNVTAPELILNTTNKLVRIMRLATYFDAHAIRVKRNAGGEEFVRQAKAFPNGDFDDGLDGAEMAIRLLNYYATGAWNEDEADILVA